MQRKLNIVHVSYKIGDHIVMHTTFHPLLIPLILAGSMPHVVSRAAKSVSYATKSVLYGAVATPVAGALTFASGVTAFGLCCTVVGVPVAIPFILTTYGGIFTTTYCASKAQHTARRAVGSDKSCHSFSHAVDVTAGIVKKRK